MTAWLQKFGAVVLGLVREFRQEIAVLVLGVALGLWGGWKLWRPQSRPKPETYAAATTQKDGSVVLERKPDPKAKPAQDVPKGAVVERVVQVVVRPGPAVLPSIPAEAPSSLGSIPAAFLAPSVPHECPPVRVDLTLVRMPDQTRRVVASSPDGQVVGGVDIPVEASKPVRDLKWAAGTSYEPGDKTWGLWADRDVGFLRVGLEANQIRLPAQLGGRTTIEGRIRAGIRF